jgi:hypothetical protein
MKSKFFTLFAAFVLLFSANASAQVNGDVNEDGVVNEQDIAAILEIMAEAGGVKEQTKYYWYVGWTKPTSLETLKTLATGTHNEMSLGGETSKVSGEKLLTNSSEIGPMIPPAQYYVVIPSGYNIYDATLPNIPITNTSFEEVTDVTITNHKVYICYDIQVTVSGLEIY